MIFKHLITKTVLNPKKLFLIDGMGAILSAFLLGIVLTRFEETFGIPTKTLYFLAIIPIFFAAYDFYAYQIKNQNLEVLLKIIAILNLIYCLISTSLVIYHSNTTTILGWIYIIIEIIIVLLLAILEYKVAIKIKKTKKQKSIKLH